GSVKTAGLPSPPRSDMADIQQALNWTTLYRLERGLTRSCGGVPLMACDRPLLEPLVDLCQSPLLVFHIVRSVFAQLLTAQHRQSTLSTPSRKGRLTSTARRCPALSSSGACAAI